MDKLSEASMRKILSEAKRKLLKYQRKKWSTEQVDFKEQFISDDGKCPECSAPLVPWYLLHDKRYIISCRQCKISFSLPDREPEKVHKRRKTE